MTKLAAEKLFAKTGVKPTDVQVVELHDCFSANELITYEALGLCPEGKAAEMIDRGDNTYGGKYVVNPSGGLISKGHPLGATGKLSSTYTYRNFFWLGFYPHSLLFFHVDLHLYLVLEPCHFIPPLIVLRIPFGC